MVSSTIPKHEYSIHAKHTASTVNCVLHQAMAQHRAAARYYERVGDTDKAYECYRKQDTLWEVYFDINKANTALQWHELTEKRRAENQ